MAIHLGLILEIKTQSGVRDTHGEKTGDHGGQDIEHLQRPVLRDGEIIGVNRKQQQGGNPVQDVTERVDRRVLEESRQR